MWQQGHRGTPPYYDPNPNPNPYGTSMYPNVDTPQNPSGFVTPPNLSGYAAPPNPSGYANPSSNVPVLSHRGVPSPLSTNQIGSNASAPMPPTYGFQAPPSTGPAGAVPAYPSYGNPYQVPGSNPNEDAWVTVTHGSSFPHGAVQAMDRPLNNSDQTAKNCYVAMWMHEGEPVFGRAWNNNGKIHAWFPHGGHEHDSSRLSPPAFSILTHQGPPRQNFRYAWVPVNQLNSMCQPVTQQEYTPVVVPDIQAGSFRGELLGKGNLSRRMAWVSHAGKEHHFTGSTFDKAYVLCRVPL